jgi:hypothetical protein
MALAPAFMSRSAGRRLAGSGAALVLGMAVYTAVTESMPDLHLYDGYWMLGGTAVAFMLVAPLAWRWPRERGLIAVAGAATVGAWLPLVLLALRARLSVMARIKGAIFFSSADVIGIALPVGAALAWLALKEYRPAAQPPRDA